ncbi:hypothetical protein SELR_pSRC500040 (plasmid) [Selenomonas ruminantium subsp. lactilytica TAM6421]|uniref:Uncharacterized protein n=1 Tax=Selenomonas ruminantium subsp. lactilytica (strain NBRC 103574 / TAM6421) TaxID=927704 RepID=I0GWP1_SELRL|nr:hypothetical protein SELR_pSRC500040 [Selenomonas ruminantium subsp. lactilytica TAM6421]
MSFTKNTLRTFLMIGTILTGCLFVNTNTSYAQDIYCGTHNGYDYYVDSNAKSGTRSGLKYIGVKRSDGSYYTYCFSHYNNVWKFNYSNGGSIYNSVFNEFQPVNRNKLANDILYTLLQIW